MAPSPRKVCVDLLEEELLHPKSKPTIVDVYNSVLRLAQCFVATTRQVDELSHEVYGNGIPGGLKLKVTQIADDMAAIKKYLEIGDAEKYGRRKDDAVILDNFDKFLKWFTDKILPPLVVGFLIFIGNLILFLAAFVFAITNGWIVIP